MLRKPYLYTDTVSFYNNNLPFELLHNNNLLLEQLSSDIINNSSLEQGFLFGKNVQTNGIRDFFNINKTSSGNSIDILNYNYTILQPLKIYKTQYTSTTINTPLTVDEISSYMDNKNFIKKQMVINDVFYLSNIPNSNLLSLEFANKYGFKKGDNVSIDSLNILYNIDDKSDNYITPIEFLIANYISKSGTYSLQAEKDSLSKVNSVSSSIVNVSTEEYIESEDDLFISKVSDIEKRSPTKENVETLFIESPSLNSPVNKKEYYKRSNEYISIVNKKVDSIRINREKEITDNDVITIDEASVIAKEIIQKTTSLSFDTLDDFEKFYENICSSIDYLKKDLLIPSEKGYVASFYNSVHSIINHKSLKRLLSQNGKVDDTSYVVDKSSNYFNSILSTEDKNNFIKIAQSVGVDIDFVRDKLGSIFNKLCSLVLSLSYPSAEDLKLIIDIDYAKPIYVNSFIVIAPNIQYAIKNMASYSFVSPVYIKVGTSFIVAAPAISRTIKSNLYYNFVSPVYIDIRDELNIVSYSLHYINKNIQIAPFIPPKYINTCYFSDLLSVPTIEDDRLWVKTKCVFNNVSKYSILHSNRAINGVELSKVYKIVLSGADKDIYMCRDCLISKELAALIVSFYIVKQIIEKYDLPVNIDLSKTITKIYSEYVTTDDGQVVSSSDICGVASTNQGTFIDSFVTANSIISSTTKIDIDNCQDSEMLTDFAVKLSEFKISDNFIDDAIKQVSNVVYNYYESLGIEKINSNFDVLNCQNECSECKSQKYIYTPDDFGVGKFDLRYSFDAFSKQAIGSRDNSKSCDNLIINNTIAYWTFLYIEGKYGDKPKNLEEQKKGISSNVVGKLYYIDSDFINTDTSIPIDELQFFNKREYGYIATIKDAYKFIYYDSENDTVYCTPNIDISVSNDYDGDKPFIKINNLKIFTNTLKNTNISTIDTNVDDFDFSFIYNLMYEKDYTPEVDALIGTGLSGLISYSYEEPQVYKVHTVVDPTSIEDIQSVYNKSGANLKDRGSIASPICEYITNPKDSFIPGHIKMRANVDAFIVTYDGGERVIKDIGVSLPFSFGIIDGYFNDDIGELLSNASTPDEIDEILNNYQFNVKKYIAPNNWYNFMSFSNTSMDSVPENKITINLTDLVKKLKTLNGEELYYTKSDGSKISVSDSEIKYGDPRTTIDPGVYISNVNIVSDAVYAKAVTKNKFLPIAVLSSNDGFKISNVLKESDIDFYKDATYVSFNDMENLVTTIYLYKKPLYNNGIFMAFNQI